MVTLNRLLIFLLFLTLSACSATVHRIGHDSKHEPASAVKIVMPEQSPLIQRIAKVRDAQQEAQTHFKFLLDQLDILAHSQTEEAITAREKLNAGYEASIDKTDEIVQSVAGMNDAVEAFFSGWEREIAKHGRSAGNPGKLEAARSQYRRLTLAMKEAEGKFEPVLRVLQDQIMLLHGNPGTRVTDSLKNEMRLIGTDVTALIASLEHAIDETELFINTIQNK